VSLVALNGVAVEYGATRVLEDVSVAIERGQRWGVVGRNGTGKTSLFRLVTGELAPARGSVSRASGLRLAYLEQHRDFGGAATVWEAAAGPFAELLELERSLAAQAAELGAAGEAATPRQLARYDRDLERFEREGGYTFAPRVDAVLHGLGFDPDDARRRPLARLSGGERGRVGLARQLVAPADLLLLDEPTNHLDLETTRCSS
jgi:ATP-binding cassette subfamily F protein 3